jgi:probable phosphoglycerate mutase
MLKTVIYFRHGETDWNRAGRFQGHSDIPLNQLGRDQALRLQPILQRFQPEIVCSSDLLRAKETARIANALLQRNHLMDPQLREVYLGQAEGKTVAEMEPLWGKEFMDKWFDSHPDYNNFCFPGGETKLQSVQRVKGFLEKMLRELPYQTLAVCGHGGTLRRFCHFISADHSKEFPIPNCCVYQIQFDVVNAVWRDPQYIES